MHTRKRSECIQRALLLLKLIPRLGSIRRVLTARLLHFLLNIRLASRAVQIRNNVQCQAAHQVKQEHCQGGTRSGGLNRLQRLRSINFSCSDCSTALFAENVECRTEDLPTELDEASGTRCVFESLSTDLSFAKPSTGSATTLSSLGAAFNRTVESVP